MTDLRLSTNQSPVGQVGKEELSTPADLFDRLNAEFRFKVDTCARPWNAKCQTYFTAEQDGLAQDWKAGGVYWCNPPGVKVKKIAQWVKKGYESALNGATVVMLLPAFTDTGWFQSYVIKSSDFRFLCGRLKFQGQASCAPFSSLVVVFSPETLRTAMVV